MVAEEVVVTVGAPQAEPPAETVTTEGLELDHVPPVGLQLSGSQVLGQSGAPPVIGLGTGVTVTTVVEIQPVDVAVYVIVCVPSETPVTVPEEVTVAAPPEVVENEPGVVASVNVIVVPLHNMLGPVGVAGGGYTDIMRKLRQPYGEV